MGKKRRRKRQRQLDMAMAAIRLRYGPPGFGQGETGGDGRQRGLLWELGGLIYQEERLDIEVPLEPVTLPALGRAERLGWEVELLGLTPGDHVVGLHREALRAQGVLSSGELEGQRDGQTVRVAVLVLVRQRPPTAKGHVSSPWKTRKGWLTSSCGSMSITGIGVGSETCRYC